MALSRRGMVAVVPLAAVVVLLFAGAAQAWNCAAGLTDCNGCFNLQTDNNNCGKCGAKCGGCANGGPVCSSGKCGYYCSAPYANCDGNWGNGCEVDTSKDVNNCGACGAKCVAPPHATASCVGGKCQYSCVAGWSNCDGNWVNGCETNTNGPDCNNCGGCGTKCSGAPNAPPTCTNGKCGYSCAPGFYNCDNSWTNGCEVNGNNDNNNCGACGKKCVAPANASAKCSNGQCSYTCNAGFANCDNDWSNGCEKATGSDVNNCGGCGKKCMAPAGASAVCSYGQCSYSCLPGFSNCDNSWTNGCESSTGSDVNNCGSCGKKCIAPPNASAQCSGGSCSYTCKAGFSNCDNNWGNGCECNPSNDNNNCGGCGKKCAALPNASSSCSGGQCTYTCNAGYANCDNNWMNGCECTPDSDTEHCGGCGNKCPQVNYAGGARKCTSGKCEVNACQSGMSYNSGKRCCVSGGSGGGMGGDKGGSKGGPKGGDKGGSMGGDKGGSKGGSMGGGKGW